MAIHVSNVLQVHISYMSEVSREQHKPIVNIEPAHGYILDLQWSPARPLVFVAATGDGNIVVYDLLVGMRNKSPLTFATGQPVRASHCIRGSVSGQCCCFQQVKVNPMLLSRRSHSHRPELLASGTVSGHVQVWRLSHELSSQVTTISIFTASCSLDLE